MIALYVETQSFIANIEPKIYVAATTVDSKIIRALEIIRVKKPILNAFS